MMMYSGGRGALGSEDFEEKSGNGMLFWTIGAEGQSGAENPDPDAAAGRVGYEEYPKLDPVPEEVGYPEVRPDPVPDGGECAGPDPVPEELE